MQGGIGWWKQITDALDEVEILIMVMTRLRWCRKWPGKRYARQQVFASAR